METKEKKETLLKILQSLFDDNTKEIDECNCVSFYHFLLDTLEEEILEIPAEEDIDISMCFSIIELLSNFDILGLDFSFWTKENIKEYLKDFSGLDDDEYKYSISKFRKIYIFIKDDYFLNLP
jgi:hypothetical protein